MNLVSYYNKKVIVITYDGKMCTGLVDDYIYPEDNEDGLESIVVNTNDGLIEFNENHIKEIKII